MINNIDINDFLKNYWQKKPLLIRAAFPGYESPISAEELAGLACEDFIESRIISENISTLKSAVAKPEKYVVQEGDSLWRISAKLLGDGNRYHEILKINRNIIEDDDELAVGMTLKLPRR